MILENGTIRTLDPSLPLARSLAIAGDRIAGGVGTHETALASPEVVDLGGRCVLPGFTDSHVHFPTWALAQRQAKLDGCASLAEALDRIRSSGWGRGYGWRDAEWPDGPPTRQALDAISSEPMAMWSKDYHSLWLNSAALALAGGDLEVEGGVVERDANGGSDRRAAGRVRVAVQGQAPHGSRRRVPRRDACRREARARARRHVRARQGRLARRRRDCGSSLEPQLRVWQSVPATQLPELRDLSLRSGFGSPLLRIGYLKVFMDGTLGSQTAWMLDGSGVRITSGEELAEIVRAGAEAGWPVGVHAIGDRANREALDAFEVTREAWQPQRPAAADRACPVPGTGGRRALREDRRCGVGAVHARALGRTAREALLAGQARRRLLVPVAPPLGRAARERFGRAGRGARPVGRRRRGGAAATGARTSG